jgi:hypothetical protein
MFFGTIRILGIVLYKDKANLCLGLVVGLFLDDVIVIFKLRKTIQ